MIVSVNVKVMSTVGVIPLGRKPPHALNVERKEMRFFHKRLRIKTPFP